MAGERIVVDDDAFVETAVNWIIERIHWVLHEQSFCSLMLAGGGTPIPVYKALAKRVLPWDRLKLYFGDERCVPKDHKDSNFKAVTEALFPQGVPEDLILYRMQGELDPKAAAEEYERLLPDPIDILLLGMGGDGHTASLFPGSTALNESTRRVLPVIGSKPPPQRLSITPIVIASARYVLVLAEGKGKAEAVHRALEVGDVPVSLAIDGDWLLDHGAASVLRE